MKGKVLLAIENTYLRWDGRAFNPNTSGSLMDGLVGGDFFQVQLKLDLMPREARCSYSLYSLIIF